MIKSSTAPARAPISWKRMKCDALVRTVITQLHIAPGSPGVSYQTSIAGDTIIATMSPTNTPESRKSSSRLVVPICYLRRNVCLDQGHSFHHPCLGLYFAQRDLLRVSPGPRLSAQRGNWGCRPLHPV